MGLFIYMTNAQLMVTKIHSSLNSGHLCRSLVGLRGGCTVAYFVILRSVPGLPFVPQGGFSQQTHTIWLTGSTIGMNSSGNCLILWDQDRCHSLRSQCSRAIPFTARWSFYRLFPGLFLEGELFVIFWLLHLGLRNIFFKFHLLQW